MYENPFYEPYWTSEEELEHFGVKGMKWGVRRYQNADGTLTEAGKKKLEKYKERETKIATGQRDRYAKKYEKAKSKREEKGRTEPSGSEKYNKKYKEIYEKELKAIKTMSYKDMQSDKIAAGKTFLTSSGMAMAMSVGITIAAGSPWVVYNLNLGTQMRNSITNNRLKRYDQQQKKK